MSEHPVVVYAASGYTGRLTCEALAKRGIPFVAAGRSRERLERAVGALSGADATVRVVDHDRADLARMLDGAKVVVNTSGPFSKLGRPVVEAALAQGCHYVDTTGEQDFMLAIRDDLDAGYRKAGLALLTSCAFLFAPGACAAEVCLETPGVDSVKVICAPPSLQTVASLQSMIRASRRPGFRLAERSLVPVEFGAARTCVVPGTGELRGAVEIGGGEATWLLGDPRVRNVESLFASDALAGASRGMRLWKRLSKVVPGETLDRWSDKLVARYKKTPPRETIEQSRYVIAAHGEGNETRASCILYGTAPYLVTAWLCAEAAERLLSGPPSRCGYVSVAQAFGARSILSAMEGVGTRATTTTSGLTPAGASHDPA